MARIKTMTEFSGGGASANQLLKGFLNNFVLAKTDESADLNINACRTTDTLAEVVVCSKKFNNPALRAFTLAEVLITLGIIGIVAAMTLPTVINNARNKEHQAKFKQAYSLAYQAVLMMGQDDPELWQTYCAKNSNSEVNSNRDKDYSFIRDFSRQFQTSAVHEKDTRNLQTLGYKQEYFYTSTNGKKRFNTDSHNNGAFVGKNGMIVFSSGCWWANGLDFVIDTNGLKGPNKFGYDVFYFQIAKNNQLLPSSINSKFSGNGSDSAGCCTLAGDSSGGGMCNSEYFGGSVSDNGSACSRFALMDAYPGDEGRPYWKNLPTP